MITTIDERYDNIRAVYEGYVSHVFQGLLDTQQHSLLSLLNGFVADQYTIEYVIDRINSEFEETVLPAILPRILDFAKEGVRISSLQLNAVSRGALNKSVYVIKSIDYKSIRKRETFIIDWSLVERSVLELLTSDSIDRSWYGLFEQSILSSNDTMIRRELTLFVRGESTLTTLHDNLTRLLYSEERARRVVRTSLTDVFANAQQESYRVAGTKRNRWYTKYDKIVCPYCIPLHNEIVDIGRQFSMGVTRPPLHVGCRCYLSPVPLTEKELFDRIDKRFLRK